ncbi:MAG TPA: lipoyl(octanoyl) transferase LipB [Candidatus Acidoferrales bacterium]|nr:lipoyl(octanoyl) transferase LipB [Candidatus Acidoferrales bacterium]
MSASNVLAASLLGRIGYLDGWRLQEAVAGRVRDGDDERLLLLEHDPVYTIGRRGTMDHLLVGLDELRDAGASVYRVDRGGDITYHGPGQLVGYPIVRLGERADLVRYVRGLEDALIGVLDGYGIAARAEKGKTGVWVDLLDGRPAKIAAIGVRVSRGVTTHGFALNVSTDLAAFARMVPCGFMHEVASLTRLGVQADLGDVALRVARALAAQLDRQLVWSAPAAARDDEIPDDAPVRTAEDLVRAPVPA